MTEQTITFDTFTIKRTLAASPEQVFASFADVTIKTRMLAPSEDDAPEDEEPAHGEFDFRVGGRERFNFVDDGRKMSYDALYYDIVPNQRIVYSYEMYANESRISVSVASIQFLEDASSTTLIWTEQGAFLDGLDTSDMREGGTSWMIENMAEYFEARR